MSHELTVLLVVAVGAQLAIQAPINSGLGRTVGKLAASFTSNMVGLTALLLICLLAGQLGRFGSIEDASLPTLFGGIIGATYVAVSTITVSRIGAGAVAASMIAGQLTGSLIVDNFGWVGVETIPINWLRLVGAVLLLTGTVLVVYRKRYAEDIEGAGRAGLIAALAMVASGFLIAFQHPLNAEMSEHIGSLNATFLNFFTGTVLLALLVLFSRQTGGLRRVGRVRWYYLLGGLIGLITVLVALTAVKTIGDAGLTAAIVTGQLLASVALDRFGIFGLETRPVTVARLAGVTLLVAGTLLTVS